MAAPVWVLSVDLQTKTATFQSGMAEAAKSARGSFNDIKTGAAEMAQETSVNMSEARHGVMLLGEEFGVHLPRALTSFIASIGPVGAAMEAAFPFLAIIVGATLLIEHLEKVKEAGERLTEDQEKFKTAVANAFGKLDEQILQAGIRADELSGNHLAALQKQLQLIDKQSMSELVRSFEEVAKAADLVFADIDKGSIGSSILSHFGAGADGAKHALQEFKTQYDSLLAQGKDKEASDLLAGTLSHAKEILSLQEQANKSQHSNTADSSTFEAIRKLQKDGISNTDQALAAQRQLVDVLEAQVGVQGKIVELKKIQDSNATQSTQKTVDADDDKLMRQRMEEQKKAQEEQDKLDEQAYQEAVTRIQQGEREKIAATDEGSAARLAAIDKAIKEENAKGLQETGYYRELLTQRIQLARQLSTEEGKLKQEAGTEASAHQLKIDELQIQSKKESDALKLSSLRNSEQAQLASEIEAADADYKAKMDSYARDIAALDTHGKDYENKLKAIQDREAELTRAHENEITAIKDKAEEQRNARVLASERRFDDTISRGLADTIMRHQTFGKMLVGIGDQIATGMMQNAIKSIMADDMTKERDAAAAARKAYLAGMQFPFPINVVMGPTLAAAAFASVMAFESGGIVPGAENFDSQPAMLKPGEAVIPKEMTERLSRASGSDDAGSHTHLHVHQTNHLHAIDSTGVKQMLDRHKEEFSRHFHSEIRRLNR